MALGEHRGLIHFTVGQRRGLEIGGAAEPYYVLRLEPETKRVVVGPRRALAVGAATAMRKTASAAIVRIVRRRIPCSFDSGGSAC